MFKEIAHFVYHAPSTLGLMRRTDQAELYDILIERAEAAGLAEQRAALVGDLEGEVLEVGCGTGKMFRHYPAAASVTAIEPDESFLERALPEAEAAAAAVTVREGDGLNLPFEPSRFDAVVFGLVLCSVPDVEQALAEARRVLRPGGELRLLEHVISERRIAGALMHAANPLWRLLNQQGCNLNRDPLPLIEQAGFRADPSPPFQIFAAGLPAFPMRLIQASRD